MLRKKTWDSLTDSKILELHPKIRVQAKMFVQMLEDRGIFVRIYCAYRSPSEQLENWKKGRDQFGNVYNKSLVVTNARPFESYHQYSLAFDCVEILNGKAQWEGKNWEEIGHIGDYYGFEWGGRFMNFTDKPHFQMTFGKKCRDLKVLHDKVAYDKDGFLIF